MSILSKDTIEAWYYDSEETAILNAKQSAVGYIKVKDGILKERWGERTDNIYIESKTKVKDKNVKSKKVKINNKEKDIYTKDKVTYHGASPVAFKRKPLVTRPLTGDKFVSKR